MEANGSLRSKPRGPSEGLRSAFLLFAFLLLHLFLRVDGGDLDGVAFLVQLAGDVDLGGLLVVLVLLEVLLGELLALVVKLDPLVALDDAQAGVGTLERARSGMLGGLLLVLPGAALLVDQDAGDTLVLLVFR